MILNEQPQNAEVKNMPEKNSNILVSVTKSNVVVNDQTINDTTKEVSKAPFFVTVVEPPTDNVTITNNEENDESIIDITEETLNLPLFNAIVKYPKGVPFWQHHYVYSHTELEAANNEQRKFYNEFKSSFLSGIYYDVEGNSNYTFILLFDLLNEYDNHKDLDLLYKQLKKLGEQYPKTKPYCNSFYNKITEADSFKHDYTQYYNYYENYSLGYKYKTKLNLNDKEKVILNKISYLNNNFCNIEFCCLEVSKLYLKVINELNLIYESKRSSLEIEFMKIADTKIKRQYGYKKGSNNYNNIISYIINELYVNIFKICENAIRDKYHHKRKLTPEYFFIINPSNSEFENKIIEELNSILNVNISSVSEPDEATEVILNTLTPTRWKVKIELIKQNYISNTEKFIEEIHTLAKQNKKNPQLENIYFDACKIISQFDKQGALKLYIHYLYYDLKSPIFDNKKLTKTIQKSLFGSNEQLQQFETIVNELVKDKDLDKALLAVSDIYKVKRKRIELDKSTIHEVQKQHSGTVELLNEYLLDEDEGLPDIEQTLKTNDEEIQIAIDQTKNETPNSSFSKSLSLSPLQRAVLEIFYKNSYSIHQSEIEAYAKCNGVFKNQLIESINELCFDMLDDVLIEEDEEYYTINPDYFSKIQNND